MTNKTTEHVAPTRTLSSQEINHVSGGMKWERGHVSPNVIDARGGQFTVFGWRISLDIKGKVSNVERA
jgi:hypothetical protein